MRRRALHRAHHALQSQTYHGKGTPGTMRSAKPTTTRRGGHPERILGLERGATSNLGDMPFRDDHSADLLVLRLIQNDREMVGYDSEVGATWTTRALTRPSS